MIRKREVRKNRSKEEQSKDKVKAKEGMRQARYQGYIMDESTRSKTKFKDVERIWRCFWDLSDAAKQILKAKEPEIAEKLDFFGSSGTMMPGHLLASYSWRLWKSLYLRGTSNLPFSSIPTTS